MGAGGGLDGCDRKYHASDVLYLALIDIFLNVNLLSTLKCWEISLEDPDSRLLPRQRAER